MNLKLRAAAMTLGVIGTGLGAGFVMSYLPNWAVAVIVLVFACYFVYTLSLAQLEYDKAIEEMNEKYKK